MRGARSVERATPHGYTTWLIQATHDDPAAELVAEEDPAQRLAYTRAVGSLYCVVSRPCSDSPYKRQRSEA
jgi:hypothetical protein